jgi:putative acetyltransferase
MIVREVGWDHPGATALRDAQRAEIAERYGTNDSEPGPAPTAADITAFFVAFDEAGEAIACGGLREIDETHGEVKRMFVHPAHRGSGVSTAVLTELEAFAAARGWTRLVLETGDRQPDAIRFYTREGFTPIPRFGHYAGVEESRCFEKPLIAVDPSLATLCEGCE